MICRPKLHYFTGSQLSAAYSFSKLGRPSEIQGSPAGITAFCKEYH